MRSRISLFAITLALGSTGCSGGDPPVINSFTANPMTVKKGGTTMLSWSVDGAGLIKITANPGGEVVSTSKATGTMDSAAISEDTMFTLEATNGEGSVSQTISVLIEKAGAPTIDSFTATPNMVESGGEVVLAWETTNATSVDIDPAVVTAGPADGQMMVTVGQTTTYVLTARNETGTIQMAVTVTVPGPRIERFTATPQAVNLGQETTLAWTVVDAVLVTITNDQGEKIFEGPDLNGSVTDVPTVAVPPGTVTYTLIAVDAGNSTIAFTATVNVNPAGGPTVMLTANPDTINLGQTSTLTWAVTNAVAIEIQDGAGTTTTSTDLTGSVMVMPSQTTQYTLVARDANNVTAMAMATVTLNAGPPQILDFDAQPNPVALGSMVTLSFSTVDADTVRILNGTTEVLVTTDNTGTATVTPTAASTVYMLEVSNALGMSRRDVTVYAHPAPVIRNFTVTPLAFTGSSTTAVVTWDVSNVATLDLLVNGVAAAFPALNVSPMITDQRGTFTSTINGTTPFKLVAKSAGGTEERDITVESR